jgi:hypothetical protein
MVAFLPAQRQHGPARNWLGTGKTMAEPQELLLRNTSSGRRTAEEERDHLAQYFVETEHWRSVYTGETDIIYGAKGSGKSAVYNLLLNNESALFDQQILVAPAENPQGAPAFNIFNEKKKEEIDLVYIWKLYILSICANQMRQYSLLSTENGRRFMNILQDAEGSSRCPRFINI